ncbi:MAG TPA: DUF1553 domain-containing protein [Pirellulales bacterium]|nr:DUF1553 domain-containing protein [Pirellulales bacterium]
MPRNCTRRRGFGTQAATLVAALAVQLAAQAPAAAEAPPPAADAQRRAGEQFFETKVRPILAEHCYKCHGPERHKANLRLDSLHAMLSGGDSGPAIVAGDSAHSLLMQVIGYGDDNVQMPPTKKLPDALIADLTRWVQIGAPWPGAERHSPAATRKAFEISDQDRGYWFFQPIRRAREPRVADAHWPANPIDGFILSRLEKQGLAPNSPASKRELIRRAYFDLLGLPPSPAEVDRFVTDASPASYENLLDELLGRPQYGERWGRHWLDVVRFAQTNGYERDDEKPFAWRYRDYVITAFNADKPYDRFITEQLAGDELERPAPEALTATGFYRLGLWDDEPDDARNAEFDGLDDVVVTASAAFLGLTVGCARCHDHMFDPISQADYYRLLACFRQVLPYQKPSYDENSATYVPLVDAAEAAHWYAARQAELAPLEAQIKGTKSAREKKELKATIKRAQQASAAPFEWALAVREQWPKIVPTHLLIRGNAGTPGAEVQPAVLSVLGGQPLVAVPPADGHSSGRRLALARWVTGRDNPLAARVMVNRIWQHHFGQGIVKSTNDFGRVGIPPTHPELLDWLAAEFMDSGWSVKHMHKLIMRSSAYRMSSRVDNAQAVAADPANDLLWRQNLRRLEAECVRDTLLSVSGQLNLEPGGRGFFPHLSGEVLAGSSKPGNGWELSPERQQSRRSVYTFVKRSLVDPLLETFDYSNTVQPLGERPVTTVAPQSLMLLNDDLMQAQAVAFARRLVSEAGSDRTRQIRLAYRLALAREPSQREIALASDYCQRQEPRFAALARRLTFRPDVPFSLDDGFLRRLDPDDLLIGPHDNWSYYRGQWVGGYQGIKMVDPLRGPFALWQGAVFADGVVQGRLTLASASESGSVILRATAEGDLFRGYSVAFDPRAQSVSLRRHGAELTLLGEADVRVPSGRSMNVKIEAQGPRIRVWADGGASVLDITDPQPLNDAGRIGVASWGGAVTLDGFSIGLADRQLDLATAPVMAGGSSETSRPLSGWQYFGGNWSPTAEGDYATGPSPGGKAVWLEPVLADGEVEAEVMLRAAGGDAGLIVRVGQPTAGVDSLTAYNINFRNSVLRLGKHENNWRLLASTPMNLETGRWHPVRVRLDGPRIRVYVDGARQPQIDFEDPHPLDSGRVGLRTFNSSFAIRKLKVTTERQQWTADFSNQRPEATASANARAGASDSRQRALESLCLLILNLNELVYID